MGLPKNPASRRVASLVSYIGTMAKVDDSIFLSTTWACLDATHVGLKAIRRLEMALLRYSVRREHRIQELDEAPGWKK